MALISLELLKQHVRADDFSADDAYLEHLAEAATEWVVDATNRTEDELLAMGGGKGCPISLQQAMLLLAGHWYNQREAVGNTSMAEVPYTISAIVKRFTKLGE